MAQAYLSILGLYQYDSSVFDALIIPDGVDRELVINTILAETAELGLVYTRPDTVRGMVGIWSRRRLPIWTKLLKTTKLEYDPISNYDRREEWKDSSRGQSAGSAETTDAAQAFNSNDYKGRSKANSETGASSSADSEHTAHIYGNIGVTTSQQMIEEERRVVDYDLVDIIAQEFKAKFCIMVY